MKYLADLIGDKYTEWLAKGEDYFVLLRCGCGRGKTYFILRVFLPYVLKKEKTVNIFVPRRTLYQKIVADVVTMLSDNYMLEKNGNSVTVSTYQELEKRIETGKLPSKADINIVEEASYFLDDSNFSRSTVLSYRYLSSADGRTQLNIWISGTGKRIFERLVHEHSLHNNTHQCKDEKNRLGVSVYRRAGAYEAFDLPSDFSWMDIRYLDKDFDICELIKTDPDSKWVVFLESKRSGAEYYKKLKERNYSVAYLNAENMESEQEVVDSIASIDKFRQQILLTTAVIESGNDFTELRLQNVVVLCSTENRFLQMIARRRKQNADDKIRLFIPKRDVKYFERRLEDVTTRLNTYYKSIFQKVGTVPTAMNTLMEADDIERDRLKSFFAVAEQGLTINELLVEVLIEQRNLYKRMCNQLALDEHAFIKEQLRWLNREDDFDSANYIAKDITDNIRREIIEKMRAIEGKILTCDELGQYISSLSPLIKKLNKAYVKGGTKRPRFEKLCKEYEIPCRLEKTTDKERKVCYVVHLDQADETGGVGGR